MGNPATQAIALVLLLVASVAHAASSTSGSWPFTDNLIAEYDESVVQGLHLTTTAMLAEPVEKLLTLRLMLYTKAIEFNTTNATRADRDNLRKLLFSQVRSATSKTTLTTWLGLAFQDDGSNMWLYPGNEARPPRPSMTTALRRPINNNGLPRFSRLPCAAPLAATLLLKQTRGLLEQTTKRQRKVEFRNKQVNNVTSERGRCFQCTHDQGLLATEGQLCGFPSKCAWFAVRVTHRTCKSMA